MMVMMVVMMTLMTVMVVVMIMMMVQCDAMRDVAQCNAMRDAMQCICDVLLNAQVLLLVIRISQVLCYHNA